MNLREASKANWSSDTSVPSINAGSLQRIADATELMAKRHTDLIAERDRFERHYKAEQATCRRLVYQLRAAKGQATRARDRARAAVTQTQRAFNCALNFALDNGDCIATHEFLTLWREGAWDALDTHFPAWVSYCAELGHDPRAAK